MAQQLDSFTSRLLPPATPLGQESCPSAQFTFLLDSQGCPPSSWDSSSEQHDSIESPTPAPSSEIPVLPDMLLSSVEANPWLAPAPSSREQCCRRTRTDAGGSVEAACQQAGPPKDTQGQNEAYRREGTCTDSPGWTPGSSRTVSSTNTSLTYLLPYSALKRAITHFIQHPVTHTVGPIMHAWTAAETGAQEREDPASGHLIFKGQSLVYVIFWATGLKS